MENCLRNHKTINSPFSILNFQLYNPHRSLVCRAHQAGVGLQRLGHLAVTSDRRHGTCRQFGIGQPDVDGAVGDVYLDDVTVHQLADVAAGCCFGRDVADAQARRATAEAPVGNEGTLLAQVARLDIRGGIEHLLHPGPPLGPSWVMTTTSPLCTLPPRIPSQAAS